MHNHLLVIEDDAMLLETITAILELEGYLVTGARNGASGIELARELPALIICDIRLPDMDGFTLLETLQADPQIALVPVIVLSALSRERAARRALAAGARAYIRKPFRAEFLLQTIRRLLGDSSAADAAPPVLPPHDGSGG